MTTKFASHPYNRYIISWWCQHKVQDNMRLFVLKMILAKNDLSMVVLSDVTFLLPREYQKHAINYVKDINSITSSDWIQKCVQHLSNIKNWCYFWEAWFLLPRFTNRYRLCRCNNSEKVIKILTLLKGPLLFIFSGRITIVFSFQMFFIMLLECGMNIITFCGLQKKYYLQRVLF